MKINELSIEDKLSYETIYRDVGISEEFWTQLHEAPSDVRAELLDYVENIEMLQWMSKSPDDRGYARNKERDSKGRIIVDITKPHVLEDMDFFRERAIFFQKHGKYTNLYPNPHPKSEYKKFWDEETRRCKDGLVRESDGEWISGYYYFYLNYFPIMRTRETGEGKRAERDYDFVDVWDSDYLFFHYIEQGEAESEYGAVLKTRGRGYSFKVAGMLARNFYFYKKSKGFAFASESEFLTKDGILNKSWDGFEFLNEHTPWTKLRQKKDTLDYKRASYIDTHGNEKGYMSEVIAVTTKGNPEKGRGKRGKLLVHEEGGLYPGLLQTWNIARPSIEDGDYTFGYQVVFGTGGTLGAKFEGLEELFYRGGGYKVKMLRNVWDKVRGQGTCAFFVPEYVNRKGCYDTNGNSNVIKALIEIIKGRVLIRENASKANALTQEKAERPCISKNTIVSNTSIGSNKIINFDNYFINGDHELFELETIYGRKLECTFDHEIYNGETYKEAGKYNIGDRIKLKEFIPNTNYVEVPIQGALNFQKYNIKIDEDFARMLGLYMGDGSFYNNTIEFSFDERDVESIEWLIDYFKRMFKTPIAEKVKGSKMIKVAVHSTEIKEVFIQLDLIKKWNGNKHGYKRKIHIPVYIFQSPKSVIAAFLQGYFDSDGGVYSSLKNIRLFAKEKNILEQVQILLSAFGIYCKVVYTPKVNGEGRIYSGNSITLRSWELDLFKEIGFISKRKQDMYEKWISYESKCSDKNYGYDFIKSFTSIGIQEVYDIQTEEGCYSANGIWAHNCTPQEAVMRIEGSLYPVDELKGHLEEIMPDMNKFLASHYIGKLQINASGILEYSPSADAKVIREFPLKDNINKEGAIEIFEMPVKDGLGNIPKFRYYAGIDPIDDDTSTTNSLASIFIADIITDRIVAEYTGRPRTANEFYEICLRLLKFYNAVANYENDKKGLFAYLSHRNMISYLADNPQILKDMELVKSANLYGNKSKGTNSGVKINAWGRRLQADWMIEPAYGEEKTGKLNLHKIRSIGYIKEAIGWNPESNFDRCLLGDSNILMENGMSKLENLLVGDSVISKNGLANKIYEIHESNYDRELFYIRNVGNHDYIKCTDNHPIFTKTVSKVHTSSISPFHTYTLSDTVVKRADQIDKNDLLLIPTRKNRVDSSLSDELKYVLGWVLGDGYINDYSKNKTFVTKIYFQGDQYNICKNIEKIILDNFSGEYITPRNKKYMTSCKIYKEGNMYKLIIHSKQFHDFCKNYLNVSPNKKMSDKLFNSTKMIPFLRGYFEADGHYEVSEKANRKVLSVTSSTETEIYQIRQILLDEGIWCTVSKSKGYKLTNNYIRNDAYTIYINNSTGNQIIKDSLKFESKGFITNKTGRYFKTEEGYWTKISQIKKEKYSGLVYNISVENDPSYVANGIVTHNCSAMGMLMILREEYKKYKLQVSEAMLGTQIKNLSNDPFFNINYDMRNKIDPKLLKSVQSKSYNDLTEFSM